jgi:tetratricopeptide (TPR) repeat protein
MLVTIAVYWPATHHDFVNYDDDLYLTENAHVTGGLTWENARWAFGSGHAANWHPLTWLSHMLDCQLFGVKPWGHHFTSVLFHAFNAALVFVLLQRLTGALWPSLWVAALFALHPLRVESVAWIAERKDVLSGFFGLLALIFYARYAARRQSAQGSESQARPAPASATRRSSGDFALALFFLALGLMSKPMLVTWPFVMLLLDYWPLNRVPPAGSKQQVPALKRLLIEKLPFFALVALACVVTFCVQKSGGTVGTLPIGTRVGNALVSYLRYLQKLFWPANLAVFYPQPDEWPIELVALALGLLVAASAVLWLKRKPYPFLLVGWLWFAGTLVPVIGLVQVGQQAMADRYTYLPSIGVFLLVVWGTCEFAGRYRMALLIASSTALIICAGLTREQLACWQNSEALFQHALKVTDNNYVAHNNLGAALAAKGQVEEAIAHYQEAIRLRSDDAKFHSNLGNALGIRGRIDEAIAPLQEAVRLKPNYAETHNDLGMALATKGRMDDAIREFQEAIHLKPDFADPHSHLGSALNAQGRTDEAIQEFQQALRLNPDYAEVHNKLGFALSRKGQADEAILHYREAIRLRPNYAKARYNLGNALAGKGQFDEAIILLQEAIRLQPDYAEAHNDLGLVLGVKGQTDDAIGHFQEAVRLRPGDAAARKNLDNARAAKVRSAKQSSPSSP